MKMDGGMIGLTVDEAGGACVDQDVQDARRQHVQHVVGEVAVDVDVDRGHRDLDLVILRRAEVLVRACDGAHALGAARAREREREVAGRVDRDVSDAVDELGDLERRGGSYGGGVGARELHAAAAVEVALDLRAALQQVTDAARHLP